MADTELPKGPVFDTFVDDWGLNSQGYVDALDPSGEKYSVNMGEEEKINKIIYDSPYEYKSLLKVLVFAGIIYFIIKQRKKR